MVGKWEQVLHDPHNIIFELRELSKEFKDVMRRSPDVSRINFAPLTAALLRAMRPARLPAQVRQS